MLFRPLKKAAVAAAIIPSRPFEAFFKDKVVLPMNEISRNSETVNGIVQNILEEVRKKDKRFALEILNSGNVNPVNTALPFTAPCHERRIN